MNTTPEELAAIRERDKQVTREVADICARVEVKQPDELLDQGAKDRRYLLAHIDEQAREIERLRKQADKRRRVLGELESEIGEIYVTAKRLNSDVYAELRKIADKYDAKEQTK